MKAREVIEWENMLTKTKAICHRLEKDSNEDFNKILLVILRVGQRRTLYREEPG
jgi:hypothetical protein